jgi:hypothetical protein
MRWISSNLNRWPWRQQRRRERATRPATSNAFGLTTPPSLLLLRADEAVR